MSQDKTKKTMLVTSAKTIFMEKGYDNTTVEEICGLAGVAKGTFFYYFETKKHIILDMISKYIQELKLEFCKNLSYTTSIFEKLDLALDILFCTSEGAEFNFRKSHNNQLEWVEQKLFEMKIEMLTPILYDIIVEGKRTGAFRVDDVEITCSVLLNGLNAYYSTRKKAFSDPKQCKRIYKGIDEILNKILSIDADIAS